MTYTYGDKDPEYGYVHGPDGPLAELHERLDMPQYPLMISVPIGWHQIVLDLNAEISHLLPDYTISQVKEKFGELRFYIESFGVGKDDPRIDIVDELIKEARIASHTTCQVCGSPDGVNNMDNFWCGTYCDDHTASVV